MDNKIKLKKKHKREFDRTKAVSVACSIIPSTWHNVKVRNLFPLLITRTSLLLTMPHEQNIIDLVCSLRQSQEQKVDMISMRGNLLDADLFNLC